MEAAWRLLSGQGVTAAVGDAIADISFKINLGNISGISDSVLPVSA